MSDAGDGDHGSSATPTSPDPSARAAQPTVIDHVASTTRLPRGAALGRYLVTGYLGTGGMGVVYSAHDPELDRRIALKVLRPELSARSEARARWLLEARAMAQLSHPNVVPIYDVGLVRDQVFIAMELVQGMTLRRKFDRTTPWRTVVTAYLQAARGLSAAHAAGLVHRDFKPDNVLFGNDGRVRVVDFGLVTTEVVAPATQGAMDSAQARAVAMLETPPGLVVGTPAFMAPESMGAAAVDARADQFSFCVALFHDLYGRFPFGGSTLAERVDQIVRGEIERPAGSAVPERLFPAVVRGLRADPDDRHPSMDALVAAIEQAVAPRPLVPVGGPAADYAIERQRHDGFVGRAALLARLDQLLITDRADRWVVVTGGPGTGKSALLATWLAQREQRGEVVPHHFIRRGEYDWDDPAHLVSSLISQIEQRFPDRREPVTEAPKHPAARLAAMLGRVSATELAPRGERMVVLVDGLDEYDPPAQLATGDPLAAFLPHALPRGVSFLCASRPRHPYLPMLEARDGELVRLDLDDPALAADNDATVRELWERGAPPLALDARFIDEAVACAGGNLQHAVTLRKHLAGLPAEQRRVERIPRGLAALLVKLWRRIAADPIAVRGLGILCAAREPLTLDELSAVAGWTDEAPRQAFVTGARELLVESRRADQQAEYRLHHDAIRAHIAATLGAAVLRGHHAALARQLATWPPPADPITRRYALHHALSHRAEAGDWAAVWQLAAEMTFLEAKCRDQGAHQAEADVARAAERCRASGDEVLCRRLDDLARALTRESHWLRHAPEATAALIWNRLRRAGWTADELDHQLRLPPGSSFLRVRHQTARDSAALVRDLIGHGNGVTACSVTPDGRRVVSASEDRTLKIWDLDTGCVVATLEGHAGRVLACSVTPDGRRVVSASEDRTLKVWDLATGRVRSTLEGHADCVTACAVTPDGRRVVSASEDQTLKIWDLDTGRLLGTLAGHAGWVCAVAVAPDGRRAVSASYDRTLKLWDLDTSRVVASFAGHAGWVLACAVTPDGRHVVSASEDQTLKLWELDTGRLVATFEGHASWVTGCAITPDGRRVISTSYDRRLNVWDTSTGRVLATLEGHATWVTACAVTPDGRRVVSASDDHTLKLWDLDAGRLASFEGHAGWVTACRVTPDGRRAVSTSEDHTLKIWDTGTGRVISTFEGHAGWVTSCAVTPDGHRVVSTSDDHTLKLWNLATGQVISTFEAHAGWVFACAVTPDGRRLISASVDHTLKVWELATGRVVTTLNGHSDAVYTCAVTPDGRRAFSGGRDRTLRIWDLDRGCLLFTLEGHAHSVHTCAVTPDGRRVISGAFDDTLKVWDTDSGRLLATIAGHTCSVYACAVTPDGRRLISASSDRTVKLWDLDSYACLLTHRGDAPYIAVAATATAIVAGDDAGNVWFLDVPRDDLDHADRPGGRGSPASDTPGIARLG